MKKGSKSKIVISVHLNNEKRPEKIEWQADQLSDGKGAKESKAMFLSLFDGEAKDTMKLDLWTNEFQIAEMDRFVFHSLRSMADAYVRATNNTNLGNEMQKFAHYFGEETGIIPKGK
jgi:gliding motility-associated protein GldC